MTSPTEPQKRSLAETLAKLDEIMRGPRGSSSEPDRRRAAARLSDLARCKDSDLPAFAKRHLPGRAAGEPALQAARDLVLAVARVLGPDDASPEALTVLEDMRRVLDEKLGEAKKTATLRETEAAAKAALEAANAREAEAAAAAAIVPALPLPLPPVLPSSPSAVLPAPLPPVRLPPRKPPPPPARGRAPVWAEDPDAGTKVYKLDKPAPQAMPFVSQPQEEPPRRAITRLDAALPFHPVATIDDEATSEASPEHLEVALPFQPGANIDDEATSETAIEHLDMALPFHPATAAQRAQLPISPPSPDIPGAAREPRIERAPPEPKGVTVPTPAAKLPAAAAHLTLDQYVWLVVTCEQYPDYAESTLASYGIQTAEDRAALDAFWASTISADPELTQRWNELYTSALNYVAQAR